MSNANETAFPFVEPLVDGGHHVFPGLNKRELFAAMAMQGLAPHYAQGGDSMARHVAKLSVENADALLAELSK